MTDGGQAGLIGAIRFLTVFAVLSVLMLAVWAAGAFLGMIRP